MFSKGHWGYFSITDPPFPSDDYSSDSRHDTKKVAVYDVPHASSSDDNQVYPCCGTLQIKKVGSSLPLAVQTSYSLTDNSYLSLRHLSVISVTRIVLPQQILFYNQERVHLCLPLFVCPICHFTYITHSCLCMHITESHGGPETAISLI